MKLHDWPSRFATFIAARTNLPFAWGANDCCSFAGDCVQALTGVDAAAQLRGHSSAKQAYRAVKRHGGIAGIATVALGPALPAAFAQVGDVVLARAGKRDMLAVCNGGTAFAPGPLGLVSVSMADATLCWRAA
jgi:hypothetical protein